MKNKIQKPNARSVITLLKAVKLPYVKLDTDRHGNLRIFVRRNGHLIRLRAAPLSPEFYAEYGEAVAKLASGPSIEIEFREDTLSWLILEYMKSGRFKSLSHSTQLNKSRILNHIADEFGELKFNKMTRFDVQDIRNVKADRGLPEAAEHRRKQLSSMFSWARDNNLMEHDPTIGIEKARDNAALQPHLHELPDGRTYRGHHTWDISEIKQFFDYYELGTSPHICMALLFYLGVRISDAGQLGPRHVVGDKIIFTTSKRSGALRQGSELILPICDELRLSMDAAKKAKIVSANNFVLTRWGKPFSQKSISHTFSKWARAAGLHPRCTAHGVRKALATLLAQNYATDRELMAYFGWATSKQADRYTKAANQEALASNVKERIQNKSGTLLQKNWHTTEKNGRKRGLFGKVEARTRLKISGLFKDL